MAKTKQKNLSQYDLDKQEELTASKLKLLSKAKEKLIEGRPTNDLPLLLTWTANKYDNFYCKMFSNKLVIDGRFLHYCKLNKIKLDCIIHDSIITYTSDFDHEKFIAQGLFLISNENTTFLHLSNFQNNYKDFDDMTTINFINPNNYNNYNRFISEYEQWVGEREYSKSIDANEQQHRIGIQNYINN
jgi:hypothetical protein